MLVRLERDKVPKLNQVCICVMGGGVEWYSLNDRTDLAFIFPE